MSNTPWQDINERLQHLVATGRGDEVPTEAIGFLIKHLAIVEDRVERLERDRGGRPSA